MDEDRVKGAATNIGGKVKDAVGGLTGDTKTQAEGKMDQATGQVQNAYGSAKDAVAVTVPHELVHALQDQYVSLDSIQKIEGDNDRRVASQAVWVTSRPALATSASA